MKLGIIAGKGELPTMVVQKAVSIGHIPIVASIQGVCDQSDFASCAVGEFYIGQVGQILNFFRSNNVRKIVMVGKFERPRWSELQVDKLGGYLLCNIMKNQVFGDDTIMRSIDLFLQEQGFEVVSFLDILNRMEQNSTDTVLKPSEQDLIDIQIATGVAKTIGHLDIGQAVIVERGCILGVEGQEGTDQLIARCAVLRKFATPSGVLVKVAKPQQSINLDPPAIGIKTIELLHSYGFRGVAYELNKIAFMQKHELIAKADLFGMFMYGI